MDKSINLLRGWPSHSLLPADFLRTASHTALTDPSIWTAGLEYGPDPGYEPLRVSLSRWLWRFYHNLLSPSSPFNSTLETSRITITGGASQNLACLLQSFTDPGKTLAIWMVTPSYFLATPIFTDAGFAGRLRGAPEDEEGIDIAYLEREMCLLEASSSQSQQPFKDAGPHRKYYRHIIYCVPTFANPSGRTMTLTRREELVRVAREHDALVIADDVYDMLQWPVSHPSLSEYFSKSEELNTALLPRLVDIDIAQGRSQYDPPGKWLGHAVSNGSFSKLVAPGVRTGWTYSTTDFAFGLSQTGSTRSGGAASQLAATIVCELLREDEEGEDCVLDTHIRDTLRPAYARRHALMIQTVEAELGPLGVTVLEGSLRGREEMYGGFFIWLTVPRPGPTAAAIAERCRVEEDLMVGNGELFAVAGDGGKYDDAIRLCFTWEGEERLVEGVKRLARVMGKMLEEEPEDWEVIGNGGYDMDKAK